MRRLVLLAAVAVLAAAAWSAVAHPWGWAYALGVHPYPESSSTPWTYQLWSGFMPALTVLTLFGAALSVYHVHNCHEVGCWRLGRHRRGGAVWCRRHIDCARLVRSEHEVLEAIETHLADLVELIRQETGEL